MDGKSCRHRLSAPARIIIFAIADHAIYDHVRLNIFPDGGVARLRVYGEPVAQWEGRDRNAVYELSALKNGGRIVAYNDAHYGSVWTHAARRAAASIWAMAGRRGGGASPATTGSS